MSDTEETLQLLYQGLPLMLVSIRGRDTLRYEYQSPITGGNIHITKRYREEENTWLYSAIIYRHGVSYSGQSSNIQQALDMAAGLYADEQYDNTNYSEVFDDSDDAMFGNV